MGMIGREIAGDAAIIAARMHAAYHQPSVIAASCGFGAPSSAQAAKPPAAEGPAKAGPISRADTYDPSLQATHCAAARPFVMRRSRHSRLSHFSLRFICAQPLGFVSSVAYLCVVRINHRSD